MPRPPTKRNRLTSEVSNNGNKGLLHFTDNAGSTQNNSRSSNDDPTAGHKAELSDTNFAQHHKDQTPVNKTYDYAIESSPLEERGATSTRPVTRARGYSSTLSIAGRKCDGNSKIPGTPAFESSILSNFRRRPRQPSILQMMQADENSSDLDDEDFLGGLSPEDESTPLSISRGKSLITGHEAAAAAALSLSPPEPPSPSSNKQRKRKSSLAEAPYVPHSEAARHSPAASIRGQEYETPARLTLTQPRLSPGASGETMAPPMSSSPVTSQTSTPSVIYAEQPSASSIKVLEIPLVQKNNVSTNLPTLALQDELLPRKTKIQRKRLGSNPGKRGMLTRCSNEEHYEDELNHLPPGKSYQVPRNHTREPRLPRSNIHQQNERTTNDMAEPGKRCGRQIQNGKKGMKSSDKSSHVISNLFQEPELQALLSPLSSPLSSPLGSDDLNLDTPSASEPLKSRYLSEELRLQAKKFADVDRWELDFEDVIASASQGSDAFR
ncbi:uncharacterized protein BO97DRAFT_403657 [Aspergillus homomorphus CBS 101889]|uniref:Uncharacterized protein n=1 Tax=Aspergillus homomorphus (strain CBS 101889) TaxID=1450537 RepID=A0A395I489_ASPHC|nr:hypothetical protein BO97DRAFT_403657 [Aspergillus homomorphus CBS 101889]RAL15022.1 hypothetical protein BO97DRAFT_403657 [Aspergillus homomorphus CBS 101889]